jgi:hypothetical protein
MTEYEHYGESLNTHQDYFLMKKAYKEKLLIEELETNEHFVNFVIPVLENTENFIGKQQVRENEENILRSAVGPMRS